MQGYYCLNSKILSTPLLTWVFGPKIIFPQRGNLTKQLRQHSTKLPTKLPPEAIINRPLDALPSELISKIFEELGCTSPPFRVAGIRQLARTLVSLRLTSRRISEIATIHLFREFCLVFEPGSWKKLLCIAQDPKLAKYLYHLRLEMYENSEPSSGDESFHGLSWRDMYIELICFPKLKSMDCDQWTAITANLARALACKIYIRYPFFMEGGGFLWTCLSLCTVQFALGRFNLESLSMSSNESFIWVLSAG